MPSRYDFDFEWNSPYGSAVLHVRAHAPASGVVLDLGCGAAAPAGEITRDGREYVGADLDPEALKSLHDDGIEAHEIDLTAAGLPTRLREILGDRPLAAVLLLDVIEHVPDPEALLVEVRRLVDDHPGAVLVLSVPNVAHFDLGAKLLAGRWDVTPTGLLDETHLRFFTGSSLAALTRRVGWREVDARDILLHHSDQHDPVDHPLLADASTSARLLRLLRIDYDRFADVNQFVRVYAATTPQPSGAAPESIDDEAPFLTVLVRTRGDRPALLSEALVSLAAQTVDSFELLVLVHTDDDQRVRDTVAIVDDFAPRFRDRVSVHKVSGGKRGTPLNAGLGLARGSYVAFLDDDDVVMSDWVQRFTEGAEAAPGAVVRSITARQPVRPAPDGSGAPFLPAGRFELPYAAEFDAPAHLYENATPICAFAVPMTLVREIGLRFSEELPVLEDWHFLMRAALRVGVHDTGAITSLYRFTRSESSLSGESLDLWHTTRHDIIDELADGPVVLPASAVWKIVDAQAVVHDLRQHITDLRHHLDSAIVDLEKLRAQADAANRRYTEITESSWWRLTSRPRRLTHFLKYRVLRRTPPA